MTHEDRFALADELYARNKFKSAAAIYREILEIEPNNARAHQNLARCFVSLKNYSEGEAEARKALSLDAQLPAPYAVLGYIYTQKKEFEEAAQFYKRALEFDPQNPRYSVALAWILASQEKYQEGLDILHEIESLHLKDQAVHQVLGFIYNKQNLHHLVSQEAWKAFKLQPSISGAVWLTQAHLAYNPIAIIGFIVMFAAFFVAPLSLPYSVPAILFSAFVSIIFLAIITGRVYDVVRSNQKNKITSIGIYLLILLFYFYPLYSRWTQPIFSSDTVQIQFSIFYVDPQSQTYVLQPSSDPPFIKPIPPQYFGIRTTVTNHLDVPLECSITDRENEVLFVPYKVLAEFEAPPGKSVNETVIALSQSDAKLWWIRCGNDLSYVTVLLDLTSAP